MAINTITYAADKIKSTWEYLETVMPASYNEINRVVKELVNNNNALQALLDLKAPLASPALTGTPTAPTPATADSSTKIATTAFVKNNMALINWKPTSLNETGQFRELIWDFANKRVSLPDGGTWVYFFNFSVCWSGGDAKGERRHGRGCGIAAGGTILATDTYLYSGTTEGVEGYGGFCWRIA